MPRPALARPRIAVLLSTYNGAVYLPAQLESLRAQQDVSVVLHARDDGSTDETCAILRGQADRWPALATLAPSENLRPAASFLRLLETAPDDADYFAFCDQDDVWLPTKLARAAAALAGVEGPALYCSNFTCVDADLAVLGTPAPHRDARLRHLIFENIATGCTVVMNPAARDLITSARPASGAVMMHDWWCALVIAALGTVIYDPEPSLLYRQHGGNVVGLHANWAAQKLRQAVRLVREREAVYPIYAQASELLRLFGDRMPAIHRTCLERLVATRRSWLARAAYALSDQIVHRDPLGKVAVRGLILAGWY
ncbi:glycosyltransferase family 2 protein [Novosphingobium bradum]|uniref:Glycosyltransferase family 2 protein n=1 Tax=Novosphingobium bradum TaxID=1737444 RepID=A0ABV7IS57_9SPHN